VRTVAQMALVQFAVLCYCYLPLYIFCGHHLLVSKLRRSNIDGSAGVVEEVERVVAQIRQC
jgi:hypothetical protein